MCAIPAKGLARQQGPKAADPCSCATELLARHYNRSIIPHLCHSHCASVHDHPTSAHTHITSTHTRFLLISTHLGAFQLVQRQHTRPTLLHSLALIPPARTAIRRQSLQPSAMLASSSKTHERRAAARNWGRGMGTTSYAPPAATLCQEAHQTWQTWSPPSVRKPTRPDLWPPPCQKAHHQTTLATPAVHAEVLMMHHTSPGRALRAPT